MNACFTKPLLFAVLYVTLSGGTQAEQTVGLFINKQGSFPGYTLFSPIGYHETYLIDNSGFKVHSWVAGSTPRMTAHLREDGLLLRTSLAGVEFGMNGSGAGGRIQLLDWDGRIVWDYVCAGPDYRQHHDVKPLPNGNVLAIAWELHSREEALAAGRDSTLLSASELWSERIMEIRPDGLTGGEVVWQWRVWDHVIQDRDSTRPNFGAIAGHTGLIDINYIVNDRADWLHFNAVDYNAELDQIVISANRFGEVWIIDHNTTTGEMAGPAGEILYRWGNPAAYQMGDNTDRILYHAHDVRWITQGATGQGDLLIFNNGRGRPEGSFTSIEQITPHSDSAGHYSRDSLSPFGPATTSWGYVTDPPEDFFASYMSGATRLFNGNTLICNGPYGTFFEVTPTGEIVWKYINPVTRFGPLIQGDSIPVNQRGTDNQVFTISRYDAAYAGLLGRDLTPLGTIELLPTAVADAEAALPDHFELHQNFPNPFNPTTTIAYSLPQRAEVTVTIYNILGEKVRVFTEGRKSAGRHSVTWNSRNESGKAVASGIYFYKVTAGEFSASRKMVLLK